MVVSVVVVVQEQEEEEEEGCLYLPQAEQGVSLLQRPRLNYSTRPSQQGGGVRPSSLHTLLLSTTLERKGEDNNR